MSTPTTFPIWKHYHNIFVTAMEGGINYWAGVNNYHWGFDDVDDLDGFSAEVFDDLEAEMADEGEKVKVYTVNRATITKGWRLATTTFRDTISWSCGKPPVVWNEDYDWDMDASDADCIVQLGLFGDVVYG